MQTLTENVFKLAPPGGLFDETVIVNLFPGLSEGASKQLVHRAVKAGEVLCLKPGLYVLADTYRRSHPHPFVIAQILYYPSHISLETGLAFHGLIPEAVFQVASVTTRRSRSFKTPLGRFTYHRVPCRYPRAGVQATKLGEEAWVFMASPLRAIADLVYLRKEISWARDGLDFLTESMRMERDDLEALSFDDFGEIHEGIRNRRTRAYLAGLKQEISRDRECPARKY